MVDIRAGLGRALAHLRWNRMGEAKVVLARLQVEADGGEDNDDIASYVSQVESQLRLPGGKPEIDWEDKADGDARSVLDEPMSDELEELAELAEEAMHM